MKKRKSKQAKPAIPANGSVGWVKTLNKMLYPDTKLLYKDAIKGFEGRCSDKYSTGTIFLFPGTDNYRIAEKIIRKHIKAPDSGSIVLRMIGENASIVPPDYSNDGSNYHFPGKPIADCMKAAYESIIAALSAESEFTRISPCYRTLVSPMSFEMKYSKRGVASIGEITLCYQTKNSSTFAILSDKNGNPFVTVTVAVLKKGDDDIVLKNQVSIPGQLTGGNEEAFLKSQSSDMAAEIRRYADDELQSRNPKTLLQIQSDIVRIIETAHLKEGDEIASMRAKNGIVGVAK